MSLFKNAAALIALIALLCASTPQVEAITYVTDTGGYAYDDARAVTNLAPAVALGTVAIVGIIAIAVQNSHDSSSSSHYYGYFSDSSSSSWRAPCSSSSSSGSGSGSCSSCAHF